MDFLWRMHEDDVDAQKSDVSAWPYFAASVVPGWRLEWGTEIYFWKKKHELCYGGEGGV